VVTLSGIVTSKDTNQYITRGEFARMLVNASSYKESASATTSMAVFHDVPASNEYASYIRIATNNGWMKAYLGGQFKPDQQITLQEACWPFLVIPTMILQETRMEPAGINIQPWILEMRSANSLTRF
jgi:hypothetical protein